MGHRRLAVIIGAVVLAAGGIAVGVAVTSGGGSSPEGTVASGAAGGPMYSYYRSMMESLGGSSMMGGSASSMMGNADYNSMMGGTIAPDWMRGSALPGFMMGTSTDPGKVMSRLFANAPGPRVSPAEATRLGNEVPTGATVDAAQHRITFSSSAVHLMVLASPSGGPDETFRSAGLVNPTIVVTSGARVSIELVNADPDTAHGLVVTASGSSSSRMPMMTAKPAFSGSAMWFLGNPTSAGMRIGTISFSAATPGTYQYLCAVPGHAQKGRVGKFIVAR
jgi:rusticyanin